MPGCVPSTSTTPASTPPAILAYVDKRARPLLQQTVKAAHHHDALHELPKLTAVDAEGRRRIVDHPPVITHPPGATTDLVAAGIGSYRESLQEDRRVLLDRYELADLAMKVVGVGSVGLYALAALLLGGDDDDPLFLQVKQAEASVLERFLPPSSQPCHGARVVAGQRRLQAASDILLGWMVGQAGPPLVRPPAPGPEGRRRRRRHDGRGPRDLGRPVRLGARARARPVRASPPRSPATSARTRRSTTRSATSRPPTPTRTSATTQPSSPPSPRAGSPPSQGSDPRPRRGMTDVGLT